MSCGSALLLSIKLFGLPLVMTACSGSRDTEDARHKNPHITQFSSDAAWIGQLEFDHSRSFTVEVVPVDHKSDPPVSPDEPVEIFLLDSPRKLQPESQPDITWFAADVYPTPNWNLASIRMKAGDTIYETEDGKFPLRNLNRDSTRVRFSSENRMIATDHESVALFTVDRQSNVVRTTIFKIEKPVSAILHATEEKVWIRKDEKDFALLQFELIDGDIKMKSQKFSAENFTLLSLCSNDAGILFTGDTANYFWPAGGTKLFSAKFENESFLREINSPLRHAESRDTHPGTCIFRNPSENEQTIYHVSVRENAQKPLQ